MEATRKISNMGSILVSITWALSLALCFFILGFCYAYGKKIEAEYQVKHAKYEAEQLRYAAIILAFNLERSGIPVGTERFMEAGEAGIPESE